jgi:hypothetical protein
LPSCANVRKCVGPRRFIPRTQMNRLLETVGPTQIEPAKDHAIARFAGSHRLQTCLVADPARKGLGYDGAEADTTLSQPPILALLANETAPQAQGLPFRGARCHRRCPATLLALALHGTQNDAIHFRRQSTGRRLRRDQSPRALRYSGAAGPRPGIENPDLRITSCKQPWEKIPLRRWVHKPCFSSCPSSPTTQERFSRRWALLLCRVALFLPFLFNYRR